MADTWSDVCPLLSWISQNRKHIESVMRDTRDIMIKAKEKSAEFQSSFP